MAKHGQETNRRDDGRLDEHAARASALLADRANSRGRSGAGASGQTARPDQPPAGRRSATQPRQAPARGLRRFVRVNWAYIVSVVAVIAIAVAAIMVLPGVLHLNARTSGSTTSDPSRYESPYDWSSLQWDDGRCQYVVDGQVRSRTGVDVSENQQDIDWNAVATDGIDFAMVRLGYRGATEGDLFLDARFWDNLDGARSAGLDCGVYFFSQAVTAEEAVEEAEFVLEYLGGVQLDYPIAFDSEVVQLSQGSSRTTDLTREEMTAIAEAFCLRIERAGYRSMVYGNVYDLSRYDRSLLEQARVWWAEYTESAPAHGVDIVMWQYSNAGAVAGIPTAVDLNIDLSGVL